MSLIDSYFSIGQIDRLSYMDTFVHRLDPRAKVIVSMAFVMSVVSYPKYEVSALIPLILYPALLIALGGVPMKFVIKKLALMSPFVVFVGIFNPVLDRQTALYVFGMPVSSGWLSFLSICVKFLLSLSAAVLLLATTSLPSLSHALSRLGMPGLFTTQLMLVYRYMFVLLEEALKMHMARNARSFGGRTLGYSMIARLLGALFVRTMERAERIYCAMASRGFSGCIPSVRTFSFGFTDAAFIILGVSYIAICRFTPLTKYAAYAVSRITG